MKSNKIRNDRIFRLTFLTLVIITIFFILLSVPYSIRTHNVVNNTNTVTRCGLSEEDYLPGLQSSFLFLNRYFEFPYDKVKIDLNDYFLLKYSKRSPPVFDSRKTGVENYPLNYTTRISEGNQAKYYSVILKEFRKIKSLYDLDDDEYLQLIVNFVQSMPYFTENTDVKFPLVTFTDGCGDCDDKSLLLLALLSQENYNVSMFIIPPEGPIRSSHAMAGVKSNSVTFAKRGYAMIETTKKDSPIGEFPSNVASEKVRVIRIGKGTKTYETHSSMWIIDQTTFRVIKKGEKTVSITQYYQEDDIINRVINFFSHQKENIDWKNDCEKGKIPFIICNSELH